MSYIKRAYYQGKIVAYLKRNGSVMRYKLATIEEQYLDSRYRVKARYPKEDAAILNDRIDELEEIIEVKVGELLRAYPNIKINNQVMKAALEVKKLEESNIDNQEILIYDFDKYIKEIKDRKKQEDQRKGIDRGKEIHPTCKDYISTRNALSDFQYDYGSILYLSDITTELIESFVDFLADERVSTPNYKYITKGGLVNSTINKRLDCLASLTRNYYKNEEATQTIISCKQYNERTDVIRLTKEEIVGFSGLETRSKSEERIRDYFVFLCLTGLRFSDLININRTNFTQRGDKYILCLYTKKTIKRAEIPLTSRAFDLACKYEFRFDYYTNQAFNRQLKDLLERHHLFEDEITEYRQVKEAIGTIVKLRRKKISAHTGRRTFISILVENGASISRIMAMTGHTKESTLKIYVDKFSPLLRESIAPLEF